MKIPVRINNVELTEQKLSFTIEGTNKYGLDKSIINSIRRNILTSIPTISFRTEPTSDLVMKRNVSSLHNEFLFHRIAMLPLYIDPSNYQKNYLFYLNVESSSDEPIKSVYANDFTIYPLNENVDVDTLNDTIQFDNYQMDNPLNDEEKDKILRPFVFNGTKHYSLLTELKANNSIELYGVPSVGYAYENARWSPVSQIAYSFKKDKTLFKKIVEDEKKVKNIQPEEESKFEKELFIKDSERYYLRDSSMEPNSYEFIIESLHFLNSKELFIYSCESLNKQIDIFQSSLPNMFSGESIFSIEKTKENVYSIFVHGYDHTIGNLYQSFISRYLIDEESVFSSIGYKKIHPLQEIIVFYISFNQKNKLFKSSDSQKNNAILQLFDETSKELTKVFTSIIDISNKSL